MRTNVGLRPLADMAAAGSDVRFRGHSGLRYCIPITERMPFDEASALILTYGTFYYAPRSGTSPRARPRSAQDPVPPSRPSRLSSATRKMQKGNAELTPH